MPMTGTVSSPDWRREALAAAEHCRLPFGRQSWRGTQGNWLGAGLGSSIDFQDHRAYAPGDDPRYIHWAAYARTGQLTMKLYRAESAPLVDIAIDVSASMAMTRRKEERLDALLAFCVESADRAAAPVRIHAASGRIVRPVPADRVRAGRWRESINAVPGAGAAPGPLPWRNGAMKILISDLLFAGDPAAVLAPMAVGNGLSLLFVPTLAEEAEIAERGNVELIDCESETRRHQQVDEGVAKRYREAYRRHFALWSEGCRRRGITLATVKAEGSLTHALVAEALPKGAVEPNT